MALKTKQKQSVTNLRNTEYYGLQKIYDDLYANSKENFEFKNLIDVIFSENNILLAYRNLKGNKGSLTPGTDNKNINDISKFTPEEIIDKVRYIA